MAGDLPDILIPGQSAMAVAADFPQLPSQAPPHDLFNIIIHLCGGRGC
ncbi:hypothetical protein THTE_2718 [Thermogutta terrifontis]|uniref:Uncharacterized protein n=1 Tax=Thermogutta terrifontis TaxID=1331910 RepID=A0A286RH94_9BACT|nr:hypothetical protein THTE_2718 [Thermogutta terrifontis]